MITLQSTYDHVQSSYDHVQSPYEHFTIILWLSYNHPCSSNIPVTIIL